MRHAVKHWQNCCRSWIISRAEFAWCGRLGKFVVENFDHKAKFKKQGEQKMKSNLDLKEIQSKILEIRGQHVILDRDVAELYGVETKEVNQAVSRNPDKFPDGYIISLDAEDWESLRSQFVTANMNRVLPKAFTEKGLYMLATILKSPIATQTTIAIVETFAKIREFAKIIHQLPEVENEDKQKSLMQKSSELLSEVLDDNTLEVTEDETTIEFNLALMKIKHSVKRGKRKMED